jgi:hypothetical protein
MKFGRPKSCCKGNLGPTETPNPSKPDLTVRTCQVCGARHYLLAVDPLELNLTGADLGKETV